MAAADRAQLRYNLARNGRTAETSAVDWSTTAHALALHKE